VRVLYFESASNPNSFVPDFDELIRRTREVNPQCLVVVDNTFLSPIHFRPLDHGAGTETYHHRRILSSVRRVLSFNIPPPPGNIATNCVPDIVIESGTKYLSGKGDVLLGAVVFRKKQGSACLSFATIFCSILT
jgi:cystathionine beta-lyase/cystathionine gamma-synthase